MSRSTLVKYKGKTIADLGRTINPHRLFGIAREGNFPIDDWLDKLVEEEGYLKEQLSKAIMVLAAHHPTKDEVEELVDDVDTLVEDYMMSFGELVMAQLLLRLAGNKDVDIEIE